MHDAHAFVKLFFFNFVPSLAPLVYYMRCVRPLTSQPKLLVLFGVPVEHAARIAVVLMITILNMVLIFMPWVVNLSGYYNNCI